MAAKYQAIRGMNDILPAEIGAWQCIEACIREVVNSYGYQEIRFPIVEKTELFKRSIGEVTDIVEKEMYTFQDNEDSLSLRPEGTACCVRAGIQNGLLHNQVQRLWYLGPMFRHERPQLGRTRQFHQFGVECFGMSDPCIDVEAIMIPGRLWQRLGLADLITLQLNTLGDPEDRKAYRDALVAYFSQDKSKLDEDSLRRLDSNPLRILDSKNPDMQALIQGAPQMMEYINEDAKAHFAAVCAGLDALGINYEHNQRLVRGLDYYNRTVFEWVTDSLGAQGTVAAGGRYDGLVEQIGGKPTPAVGFAMGMERLQLLFSKQHESAPSDKHHQQTAIYMIASGTQARQAALVLAETLRTELPSIKILQDCGSMSLKGQFKRADKSGANYALVIGDDELSQGVVNVKDLRGDSEQVAISQDAIIQHMQQCTS